MKNKKLFTLITPKIVLGFTVICWIISAFSFAIGYMTPSKFPRPTPSPILTIIHVGFAILFFIGFVVFEVVSKNTVKWNIIPLIIGILTVVGFTTLLIPTLFPTSISSQGIIGALCSLIIFPILHIGIFPFLLPLGMIYMHTKGSPVFYAAIIIVGVAIIIYNSVIINKNRKSNTPSL